MGFLDKDNLLGIGIAAAGVGLLAWLLKGSKEEIEEETKRRNTPFSFPPTIPSESFHELVLQETKKIKKKKINIEINNQIVHGIVESQSGLSTWNFYIDFNDYGSLTGKYWLASENEDSIIPKKLAELIKEAICKVL